MNMRSEWRRCTTTTAGSAGAAGELDTLELRWIEDVALDQEFEAVSTGSRVLELVGS